MGFQKSKKTKKTKVKSGDFSPSEIVELANKKFGGEVNIINLLGQMPIQVVPSISTGSMAIDLALGIGGVPKGRIVEIYGPESSGKTTLCLHVLANAQAEGGTVAFIDTEHALDPQYAGTIGVDIDNLLFSQPDCGEDALNLAEDLVRTASVDVIVIDSVAGLVPRAEIEGEMGDAHVGVQARLMSQALRKLTGLAKKSNCLILFTNQIRMKIGVMFGSPETTPGGRALKFYASIRMDIRRTTSIKDGEEVVGNCVRVKVVKNKMAPPFRIGETRIMYKGGFGFDYYFDLAHACVKAGVIQKKGAWFSYDGDSIGQGIEQVKAYLENDPDFSESLRQYVFELKQGIVEEEDPEEEPEEEPKKKKKKSKKKKKKKKDK